MSSIPSPSSDHDLPLPEESGMETPFVDGFAEKGAQMEDSGEFVRPVFHMCHGIVRDVVVEMADMPENEAIIPSDRKERMRFMLELTSRVSHHVLSNINLRTHVGTLDDVLAQIYNSARVETLRQLLNVRIGRLTIGKEGDSKKTA